MSVDEFMGWVEFLKAPEEPMVDLSTMAPDQLAKMFGGDA